MVVAPCLTVNVTVPTLTGEDAVTVAASATDASPYEAVDGDTAVEVAVLALTVNVAEPLSEPLAHPFAFAPVMFVLLLSQRSAVQLPAIVGINVAANAWSPDVPLRKLGLLRRLPQQYRWGFANGLRLASNRCR